MRKAIFIDKDGTLIRDVPYNVNTALVVIDNETIQALQLLSGAGYLLIVITNQSGLAFGYFDEKQLEELRDYLLHEFRSKEIQFDGFYFCPHHPDGKVEKYSVLCACRKPMPGLLIQAAADFDIDLENSWMIGDILNDVEAGNRAGCRSVLINNGNETEWDTNHEVRKPFHVVNDMSQAVQCILQYSSLPNSPASRHNTQTIL